MWCIGQINGDFLACMEDILEIYNSAPSPGTRRICVDERPCQLIGEVYSPLPMKAGSVKKLDNEYERAGTCMAFLAYDIDAGQRYVWLNRTRTKMDYSAFMDWLERKPSYCKADRIIVIQDNLNTHKYGSFYEHLPVTRAAELRRKMDFHFTPKHGSWLNMAEIEFSALSRQCLDRRIPTMDVMIKETAAWEKERNKKKVKVSWSFTVDMARLKLTKHYAF